MLYSSVIRERFRRPRFRGTLENPDASFEDVNPLCGDRIRIECRLTDEMLADARFQGDSCAICAAAADILIETARGHSSEFARSLRPSHLLERLQAEIRPSRMKCVTLPLDVLHGALSGRALIR